jgi:Ca2+-binding RTX toxin-like protein
MESIRLEGTVSTGNVKFDYGIRDIEVLQGDDDFAVFTSSGAYGGMTAYGVNGRGDLVQVDTQAYRPSIGASLAVELTVQDAASGPNMLVGGHGVGRVTSYDINLNGQISGGSNLGGINTAEGPQTAGLVFDDTVVLANSWGEGLEVYRATGGRLNRTDTEGDLNTTYWHGVIEMVTVSRGSAEYVVNGGAGDDIVIDGAGRDQLTGGAGADLFVLVDDDTRDTNTDFDVRYDQIDLTGWEYFKDPDALGMQAVNGGVRVTWHKEELYVMHAWPGRPDMDDLRGAITKGVTRIFEAPTVNLTGDNGANTLPGGWAADTLSGGGGDDQLFGEGGSDLLRGGNRIHGGDGGDEVYGQNGADQLFGGQGDDLIEGNMGNDTLKGQWGDHTLEGGAGNDLLQGGEGHDTAKLSWQPAPASAPLSTTAIGGGQVPGMVLNGDSRDNNLRGDVNNDTITGGAGDDDLRGMGGNDRLIGGKGDDTLAGGRENDWIEGGAGNDRLVGQRDEDTIKGGAGNDVINGGGHADLLSGDAGNDFIKSGGFDDVVWGGKGDDRVSGNAGNDNMHGQNGRDILNGGGGGDRMAGGSGDDFLKGGAGADTFVFERGDDADRIADFNTRNDTLLLDSDLLRGQDTGAEILAMFGAVTAQGVVLDFGNGDEVALTNLNSFSGLANDIEIL